MSETLLLAEDDPVQRETLSMLLIRLGYQIIKAENGREAVKHIKGSNIDTIRAVLLDVTMPEMGGFEALQVIRRYRPDLPVLMLTASDDTNLAVRAIKEGAHDFIVKPPRPEHLDVAIQNAIRMSTLSRELARLKRDKEGELAFTDLIGHETGLATAVAYGKKAAASDVPVLITGDTGAGKELFARAIHGESKRAGAPFIALNCGAIPEKLVESILFGHEKGAFTGAVNRTIGKFREAEGGTIFLDEIGDLPLDAQVKLLRVLQQKEVEPVGGTKPVKVNVRIISATHRNIQQSIREGSFREDLYFRLNVLPINVPNLAERRLDILLLAEYFIKKITAAEGLPAKTLTQDASDYLVHTVWPGNVRELENLIHRVLVLSDEEHITRHGLEEVRQTPQATLRQETAMPHNDALLIPLRHADGRFKPMSEIETEAMQRVLDYFNQNVTKTADTLCMAKSTFYRKIKKSGTPENH